jgi:predicted transcriptional regulator
MVLHLSRALEGKLAAAARRRGVSVEALAHEALERALDYDEWFIGEIESGLAQAETGQALTQRGRERREGYDFGRPQAGPRQFPSLRRALLEVPPASAGGQAHGGLRPGRWP